MSDDTIRRLRRVILETASRAKEGHIPSAYSILDILWVLYDGGLAGGWFAEPFEDRDRLILSKGHAALGLYAVLYEKGFLGWDQLQSFCQPGSDLEGHPNRRIPGVECATGSLGHGAPMSVGIALALKMKKNPARVFCIVGDSECEEGSIWEATHLAAKLKLANLVWLIDSNGTSPNRIDGDRFTTSLASKFSAFGWFTSEIDGHDHAMIRSALQPMSGDMPQAVICRTVKGKGCPEMENNQAWHHRVPADDAELQRLLASL